MCNALAVFLIFFFTCTTQGGTIASVTIAANSNGEAIQSALDHIPQGGDIVLSPGTYEIRQPIILRYDHQVLRGSGPSTVLMLADKANCPVVILGSPLTGSRRPTEHLRLADLLIDGNRQHQQVELWKTALDGSQLNNNGVDIWNVNDAAVENVVCCRCRSGGLVTADVRRLNLQGFTAYDNQFDGLACYLTEESHFSRLNLHDNLAAGISLDLSFNHNVITDALLSGNELGIFMRDSRDNTFKGLTISKSRKDGVFMAQTAEATTRGWALSPGTECTGNHFDELVVNACGRNAFLVNNSSCTNNFISGARFHGNTKGGLVEGDGKPVVVALALAEQPAPDAKPTVQPILATMLKHP